MKSWRTLHPLAKIKLLDRLKEQISQIESKDLFLQIERNEKHYQFLLNSEARKILLYGSAGSGKSWALAQYLLFDLALKYSGLRFLIVRKTRPAIKKSCWLLFNDMLSQYGILHEKNKTDLTIELNHNTFFFCSIDDPEKLKSIEKINYIWGEEATELTINDFNQLNLRCRGKNTTGYKNQLFFTFNPIDENSFLKPLTENKDKDIAVLHSTYKDNRFLEQDYIDTLEDLINQDKTYYKIYTLGQWASPEHIIYTNWDIVDSLPEKIDSIRYGLDFGYNNPSALIAVIESDQDYYIDEVIYQTKLTNNDLIAKFSELNIDKTDPITADSAEPQRIEEIFQAGYNIFPVSKGKDSVRTGINNVKSKRLHVTRQSANIVKELQSYKWRQDKNGNILDEPVKFHDHAMDSVRYVFLQDTSQVFVA